MFARPATRRSAAWPIVLLIAGSALAWSFGPSASAQPPADAPRRPTQLSPEGEAVKPDATPAATATPSPTPPTPPVPAATAPPPVTPVTPETPATPATPAATAVPPATPTPSPTAAAVPPATPEATTPSTTPPAAAPTATASTVETTPAATPISGGFKLLLILGVFVGAAVIGNSLSSALRMPDHAWRLFFVSLAVLAGSATLYLGWPPKLGVDLEGGINLIYEIKPSAENTDKPANVVMDQLIGTINKRINPGGIKEVVVRPFGADRVEIIIPGADQDELERIKKIIYTAGNLEFRIVANHHKYQDVIDAATAQQRREEAAKAPLSNVVKAERNGQQVEVGRWWPVTAGKEGQYLADPARYAVRQVRVGDQTEVQVLCVLDRFDVTGAYLTSAKADIDQNGDNSVAFTFNSEGATRFGQLTGENIPNKQTKQNNELAIILDDYLQSSPVIQSTITSRGQITGRFTKAEVDDLSEILTAGGLPTALNREPISEMNTSPSLGDDTIRSAVTAMYVAVGVVIVFMLFYYRFAGLVANIALVLNVGLTVAFMIMFNAAFTLAGLAGLALTVGMAVDANVLIYERMREELARGATLRMAIRNGFDRASVTIIDANVTTLITAVVLFVIGTDQVKGFAVALTVGLVWNLFTAITVSRLIFEIAERKRWVSNLKFMQLLGATNIDFIGKRYLCYTLSILVLGAGLIGIVSRGSDLLNIDFTGGVSITTVFEKEPAGGIAEVRKKVESELPEATVQGLKVDEGSGYKIVTSEGERKTVEDKLKKLFGDQLAYHHMTVGDVEPIAAATPATPAGPALDAPLPNQGSAVERKPDDLLTDDDLLAGAFEESAQPDDPTADAPAPTPTATGAAVPAATPTATAAAPVVPAARPDDEPAADDEPEAPSGDVFAGGTVATLTFAPPINYEKLSQEVTKVAKPEANVAGTPFELTTQGFDRGSSRAFPTWTLRLALPEAEARPFLDRLNRGLVEAPFFPSSERIGAAVADSAQQSAITAMLVSLVMVLGYIWFRFQNMAFGLAAIVALVHDVLFTVGMLALSKWLAPIMGFALVEPFKIDLTIVAAILTIIGYSLNDTIVIFDRIREVRGKSRGLSADLINLCVNQTLSRTILTSLTVFLVVVILYIWGGAGIHAFAFALVVGTMSGTYSTIYVASPVLLWLHERSLAAQAAPRAATQAS